MIDLQLKANDYEPNEVVRIIREWTELTQEEFAKSINRKERTIEDYEYGRINFSYAIFLTMCKKHDIEIILRKK